MKERGKNENVNQKRTELLVAIIGTVYSLNMFLSLIRNDYALWMSLAILVADITIWVVLGNHYHTYRFRCTYMMVVFMCSLLFYSVTVTDPYELVSYLLLYVALGAITGIPTVVQLAYGFVLLGMIIQLVLGNLPQMSNHIEFAKMWITILNIFLVTILMNLVLNLRRSHMENINQTLQELEDAKRSKDDFLANVSHELRTPVNTIMGLCEVISESGDLEYIRDNIENINMAGRKLMFSISDILDFSELQSGQIEVVEETYNITSTIYDVVALSEARKQGKNIEIIVDCNAMIPKGLTGDEKKIRRIIMNLMENAIKFTQEGYVALHVDFREEEYGGNLIVDITDTGIGIAAKDMDKIFTLFSQVDAARNRKNEGIGLGLPICQALVQHMGGVINIDSEITKGTTVRVVIPQKVADRSPILQVQNTTGTKVGIYLNLERFADISTRDEYARVVRHMVKNLNVESYVCRSVDELKRYTAKETLTHVFVGTREYAEDRRFYEDLPKETQVILICDDGEKPADVSDRVYMVSKPLSILPIVKALNGEYNTDQTVLNTNRTKFRAPEANILVVDDNDLNLEVISELLKEYEITATLAQSGPEAIQCVKDKVFDFIFMDHMMPEMDGIETLHRIRALEGTYPKEVPVIALTANEVAGAREMFLKEGFVDFIGKPIEVSVLERVLKHYIPEEKLTETNGNASKSSSSDEAASAAAENASATQEEICLANVDTQKGIYYCGGKDRYIKVLKRYYEERKEVRSKLLSLFEEEDWKNYTIHVHGMKGTLVSFGALEVAETARNLEMAGKQEDVAFIKENNEKLLAQFDAFMEDLGKQSFISGKQEKAVVEKTSKDNIYVPEIDAAKFDDLQLQLENALFDLNGEHILSILQELKKYRYRNTVLDELVDPIIEKAEMSDYISAEEAVAKMRKQIENEG